jgi:hypothetical protein
MSRLDDGFSTLISFSGAPSIKLYEKEVTPPGVQGGGATETTTMRNETWRTQAPKKLKTLSEGGASCAYDPAVYTDIVAQINVNQEITITFPDGSTLVFWGWLDGFVPAALKEGEQPTADVTIIPSNQDDTGDEVEPLLSAGA